MGSVEEYDALVIGAGFNGLHCLQLLRNAGFKVKVYEAGNGLGGTWWWNRYPGARTDSDSRIYHLEDEKVWSEFKWTERFAAYDELQRYFNYADSKLNFRKDIKFNTRVSSATFDRQANQWVVSTEPGSEGGKCRARHLILCTGFASKRYTPPFKGLDKFKGSWYHSGVWPEEGVDLKGKRVAVIGTGASGVQIIQEIGPEVAHLTVYQRTPNLAMPMVQYKAGEEDKWKGPEKTQAEVIDSTRSTFSGLGMDFLKKNCLEVSDEERRAHYEDLYRIGGFWFWLATYQDLYWNKEANDTAYKFWCEKTRARINDPVKKELLAPLVAPHSIGTKRPCLEQRYYEVFNQDNVDVINVKKSPIIEITEKGVKTEKEGVVEVDVLILATGFDSVTGGILDIKLGNGKGVKLQDKWKNETRTYLGISTAGFPNMYFLYGPHGPTAFSNGPTSGGVQGDWIFDTMVRMRDGKKTLLEATDEGEEKWTNHVRELWASSLFPATDSWYQGANIPGKPREALNYIGGIPAYNKWLQDSAKNNYEGFLLA